MKPRNTPGADGEHDVSLEDLAAFATGEADDETRDRVKAAMSDIRHPLSHLIRTKEEVREELQRAKERPTSDDDAR